MKNTSPRSPMGRRTALSMAAVWLTSAVASAAAQDVSIFNQTKAFFGQQPTLRIALVDVSASPGRADRVAHLRKAIAYFFAPLRAGDEVLLTTVGERGLNSITPQAISLAKTGKTFEDRRSAKAALAAVNEWVEATVRTGLIEPRSRYLETMAAMRAPVTRALESGAGVEIMILGDGLEYSDFANFEKPFDSKALLGDLVKRNALIRMGGKPASQARLVVIGAGAKNQAVYAHAETFWRAYAHASGIEMAYFGTDTPPFRP